MKIVLHKAKTRSFENHGWLKSYHTFSFDRYQNPNRNNFGMLRVLNDDTVQPKKGFGTHPHHNMEIISIPLQGALSHQDSIGNKRAIEVGEIQVMSAGTGITHSEFNDSPTNEVNFLQLWITPEIDDLKPYYEQRKFSLEGKINQLQTIVAPADKLKSNALPINQQAYIYRSTLQQNMHLDVTTKQTHNGLYIFVVTGEIQVENKILENRDAVGIYETNKIKITANKNSELIVIEVPMQ